jgi:Uma2 family endonuclease
MVSVQQKLQDEWIGIDEYLDGELSSDIKHEYIEGSVYAMSGASRNHERIALNIAAEFRARLRGQPCEPFSSDLKVKVGNHFFYPDAMVVCDEPQPHEYYTEAPVLIVEVLSKSTRRMDETLKRRLYQTLPSLQEYVLIEQDIVDVEVCRRSQGWVSNHYFLGDEVFFECVNLTLSVADIYARVDNDDVRTFWLEQQSQIDA